MTALDEQALEAQLRAELRAEAEIITPDSLADLRLTGQSQRLPARLRRGSTHQWPARMKPLAAAAAVAVAICGTFAVAGTVSGPPQAGPGTPAYTRPPAYYAYTVRGDIYDYASHGTLHSASVGGRYLKVRAAATGNLVTTISPPKPYNDFSLITADASGEAFVLGARTWSMSTSPTRVVPDRWTPMRFLMLRISAGGHPRVSGLSLPGVIVPAQQPSIALSPDGARLAVAAGGGLTPAVVRVISLATGRQRQWEWRNVPWTPRISSNGAWTANGRTLVVREFVYPPAPVGSLGISYRRLGTERVHLLDTAAAGTVPRPDRLVVLHPPAGQTTVLGQPFITPDGTTLFSTQMAPWLAGRTPTGALAAYSARTGARIRTVAPWAWPPTSRPGHGGSPQQTIAWSSASGSQLIVLQPRGHLNILGVLARGTFTTVSPLLPRPPGYAELQYALREGSQLAW